MEMPTGRLQMLETGHLHQRQSICAGEWRGPDFKLCRRYCGFKALMSPEMPSQGVAGFQQPACCQKSDLDPLPIILPVSCVDANLCSCSRRVSSALA